MPSTCWRFRIINLHTISRSNIQISYDTTDSFIHYYYSLIPSIWHRPIPPGASKITVSPLPLRQTFGSSAKTKSQRPPSLSDMET